MGKVKLVELVMFSIAIALGMLDSANVLEAGAQLGGKTITVCFSGCDYTQIQQAIDAAQQGDIIQIQAGYYYENVVIKNKDGLTLQGVGRDQVTIDGSGGQSQQKAGIFIEASKDITIKGLQVIQSYRGLEATRSTGLVIVESIFQQNARQGIYFRTNSKGQILNNHIIQNFPDRDGNSGVGIVISSRSSVVIRGNRVAENYVAGIYIVEGSKAEIEQNQILDNKPSQTLDRGEGIIVELGSEATIRNNLVSGNHMAGVEFYNDSQGLIEANQIRQTRPTKYGQGNGIYLSGSQVTAIGNTIEANAAHGIEMYSSVVTFNENVVTGNAGRGIVVSVGSKATLTKNTSSNNSDFGIVVYDKSAQATLTDNIVSGNTGAGIIVSGGATNVVIAGNKVSETRKKPSGGANGILVVEKSAAEIRENEIMANTTSGIVIDGSKATIVNNKIRDNAVTGIDVRKQATAIIDQKNEVLGNEWGIVVDGQSVATITSVTVSSNRGNGISIKNASSADLRDSTITDNEKCGIWVAPPPDTSSITGSNNTVTGNKGGDLCGNVPSTIKNP